MDILLINFQKYIDIKYCNQSTRFLILKYITHMKIRLIIATGLLILGFIIHSIGGELTDIKFLILSDIADNIKIEFRAVWYLISIDFLASVIFMILIQRKKTANQNNMLIDFIGIRMLLYGFVFFLLVIYTDFRILFQVPQWILLLIIGFLLEWDKVIKFIRK